MSYADLEAGAGRLARLLVDCGVQPGDRVAAQIEKSPEALLLYLAVLRSGAVYLPLNTAYKGGEVAYFLQDAEPRVLVCTPENEATLGAIRSEEHTSELQSLMRISYAVFCLKKKKTNKHNMTTIQRSKMTK